MVNDPAERGVKLCKDYLSRTTDEEFFQKVAVGVTKHREDHPITGGVFRKDILKTLSKKIVEEKPLVNDATVVNVRAPGSI